MNRRTWLKGMAVTGSALYLSQFYTANALSGFPQRSFLPTWDSLARYRVPDWFRDAKFGIWAHWGPQCQPAHGDWYARGMYQEGSDTYEFHCKNYGHPSQFGFKDVINQWKAEHWDPEELVALYQKAGARYFVALANHHDNFDLYNSRYHRWNSTRIGPKKDLIGCWSKAAKKNGLPFGVSIHAAHAWSWYEVAQRSDKSGPMAGIPYDGHLTSANGKDQWWDGFDPQELYAQQHPLSENSSDNGMIHKQWNWGNGVAVPTKAYCENFYKRTIDLIDKYRPDLLYFDDTALPLWPVSDAGLRIAAHFYNKNGNGVINGKILDEQQRKAMVWDIERGQSNQIEPLPWQTDTCIGNWHYDQRVYDENRYKSAKTVIHTLVDVVSKNGNLLLNIPVRGDGTIDEKERAVVEDIAGWMKINGEGIFGTRPWTSFGEGPALDGTAPLRAQGFNEGKGKPFGAEDFRFTTKGNTLYAIMLGWPDNKTAVIKKLAGSNIKQINLLGYPDSLTYSHSSGSLNINLPDWPPYAHASIFKIEGAV